jgi:uridine phosphorylase
MEEAARMNALAHDFGEVPILAHKHYEAPSVFTPENLLREARRQKGLPVGTIPAVCLFDPDGDLVDYLHTTGRSQRHPSWACYHTVLETFALDEIEYGIVGRVVGAPFAVLVAEELFASGCQLLISITSAGQIISMGHPPYVVLIEQALRDEGTSYHYLPPSPYSHLAPALKEMICSNWDHTCVPLYTGASWTTDAPFRETEEAIAACRAKDILAVEMEAAALYAMAKARQKDIICFAHVTNQMGQTEGDFEKGQAQGSMTTLQVLRQTVKSLSGRVSPTVG